MIDIEAGAATGLIPQAPRSEIPMNTPVSPERLALFGMFIGDWSAKGRLHPSPWGPGSDVAGTSSARLDLSPPLRTDSVGGCRVQSAKLSSGSADLLGCVVALFSARLTPPQSLGRPWEDTVSDRKFDERLSLLAASMANAVARQFRRSCLGAASKDAKTACGHPVPNLRLRSSAPNSDLKEER